jgi:aminotransferase
MSERFINPAIASVPPSGIRRFFDVAGSMRDVISLGVGEPDFVTPYHIRNAAINSILDGETQYTANAGLLPLRAEISRYLLKRCNLIYNPEKEVLVTVGASEGIDIVARATLCPGDEVLIPDPGYVSYSPCVIFAGGTPVCVKTFACNQFMLTRDDIERAITPKTKALILPYPNNPTGAVLTPEALTDIAAAALEHDLLVISDEIYCELIYDGIKHLSIASLPGMWERTITINGFSKAFAMTGWRVGYVCAPAPLLEVICKIHQYTIMCASRQSQVAALHALKRGAENNFEDISVMRNSYDQRRRLMLDAFKNMGLSCFVPRGAFYTFPSIQGTGLSSEAFCQRLLAQEKVVCVPGTAFGQSGEGYIRCCYATDVNKLLEAFKRMEHFLDTL